MSEQMERMQHPDAELLGAFVEGTVDSARRAGITAHLSICNDCLDAVAAAARSIREEHTASEPSWWSRKTFSIAAAAALIVLVGLATFRQILRSENSLERLVTAAPRDYRVIEPRLTGFRWAAVRTYRDATPSLSTTDPEFLDMAGAAGDALRRARKNENSAEAMHAAGVGQLLLRDPASAAALLEKATGLERDNAHAWSDLAAAQLTRATQEKRPADLPLALASADTALRIDNRLPEARFNRALVLEKMGLRDAAATAWRAYLEIDATSLWAVEAREHLRRLASPSGRFRDRIKDIERASMSGDTEAVVRIVDEHRQEARLWYEVEGLGQWAAAALAADATNARLKLQAAAAVGRALVALNGESLLGNSVRVIESAQSDLPRLAELAAAHRAYREGRLQYSKHDLVDAGKTLGAAADALRAVGSPMADVARYFAANVLFDQSHVPEAKAMLDGIASQSLSPALEAQVQAQLGLCAAYAGRWKDAIDSLTSAHTTFATLGEVAFTGSMDSKLAEVYELLAQRHEAWMHRTAAFRALSSHPMHDRLIEAIAGAARAELRAGRLQGAIALIDLEISHAAASANPLVAADAWRRRASVHMRLGDEAGAWNDLREARGAVTRAVDSEMRRRFEVETRLVEAGLRRSTDTRAAVSLYDGAIAYFEAAGHRVFLPEAFLDRARAHRLAGQLDLAIRDADAGIAELEAQRDTVGSAALRMRLFDQQSDLFEEAVDVELLRGNVRSAFQYSDRAHARTLLDVLGATKAYDGNTVIEAVRAELQPGEAVIEWMLVPKGVVIFAITRGDLRVYRQNIARTALERRVEALRAMIEERREAGVVQREAALLYDTLIEPIRQQIGEVDSLIVVGDRFLESIPWAALYDARRRQWLVERFAVTIAPSASVWVHQARALRTRKRDGTLLVVSPTGGNDVDPLPWTSREAREIATMYPQTRLLIDQDATVERFLSECSAAEVVHFAGHARVGRAGDGALLLMTPTGGTAELPASTLGDLRLPRTRLVVLAACGTAAGETSRLEGMPSLARGFLGAGVPSVVGSLWPLDDAEAAVLTGQLHRSLRAGVDAARALRDAQLHLLRNSTMSLRHPAAWSGVELLGAAART